MRLLALLPAPARHGAMIAALLALVASRAAVGASFSGTVVTTAGDPGAGLSLHLPAANIDGSGVGYGSAENAPKAMTDADGRFAFARVPDGPVTLVILRDDGGKFRAGRVRSIDFGSFTLHTRGSLAFTLVLGHVIGWGNVSQGRSWRLPA